MVRKSRSSSSLATSSSAKKRKKNPRRKKWKKPSPNSERSLLLKSDILNDYSGWILGSHRWRRRRDQVSVLGVDAEDAHGCGQDCRADYDPEKTEYLQSSQHAEEQQ